MATWPTEIQPRSATPLQAPTPFTATPTHGGTVTTREAPTAGFRWSETYLVNTRKSAHKQWLAKVTNIFTKGNTVTDKTHPDHDAILGVPAGTPKVKGGSQTGQAIATDGWTPNQTGLLIAGDLVQFSGKTPVYYVAGSVDSDSGGNASMSLAPSMFEGNSPADNADISTTTSVTFNAVIVPPFTLPDSPPDSNILVTINFREI